MIEREVIGVPECPLQYRWTLLGGRGNDWPFKLMVHYFLPITRDRDFHDHPRPFLTFVLRGYYYDMRPDGVTDCVQAPTIRYRPAKHAHKVVAGPRGAWTVCIMGPKQRAWGFWRDGKWWPWRLYEQRYGHGFRCDNE